MCIYVYNIYIYIPNEMPNTSHHQLNQDEPIFHPVAGAEKFSICCKFDQAPGMR
jgi:hypothetical protein